MIKKLLLPFLLLLFIFNSQAQSFRKTGYFPDYRWNNISAIDFSKLTHVFVAFVNPDSNGTISFSQNMNTLVNAAHAVGCKVIPSYGGGGDYSWGADTAIYKKLMNQNHRTAFIHAMMDFTRLYQLDGIDLDIEGYGIQLQDYNAFAQETADSVHAAGLELTAALAIGWNNAYANAVSDATLHQMDFITTMSYGGVGSWNYNNPTDQFAYIDFTNDIDYWLGRGLTKDQVVGGLAFYAAEFPMTPQNTYWQFSPTLCSIYTNPAVSAQDPLHNDWVTTVSQHQVSYNGLPTFKKKIEYAVSNASGYMVWELGGDCFNSNISILDSLNFYISEALNVKEIKQLTLELYPNPCNNEIWVSQFNNEDVWEIYNALGDRLWFGNGKRIETLNLNSGFYLIKSTKGIAHFIKL